MQSWLRYQSVIQQLIVFFVYIWSVLCFYLEAFTVEFIMPKNWNRLSTKLLISKKKKINHLASTKRCVSFLSYSNLQSLWGELYLQEPYWWFSLYQEMQHWGAAKYSKHITITRIPYYAPYNYPPLQTKTRILYSEPAPVTSLQQHKISLLVCRHKLE